MGKKMLVSLAFGPDTATAGAAVDQRSRAARMGREVVSLELPLGAFCGGKRPRVPALIRP